MALFRLWPYFLHQSDAALALFGAGDASSRVAALPRGVPGGAPYSRATSVDRLRPSYRHNTLPAVRWPLVAGDAVRALLLLPHALAAMRAFPEGAGDDPCAFAGNFAAGAGGDVAIVSDRDPSVLAGIVAATLYASRLASVAAHADGTGGSVAVRGHPALLDNAVLYLSSAGRAAAERMGGAHGRGRRGGRHRTTTTQHAVRKRADGGRLTTCDWHAQGAPSGVMASRAAAARC